MKIQWKQLLIALAIPLAVGGLSALISGGMSDYQDLAKPPLSPPGWVFAVVWPILYLLMGFASYLIYTADAGGAKKAGADLIRHPTGFEFSLVTGVFWTGVASGRLFHSHRLMGGNFADDAGFFPGQRKSR